MTDKLLFYIDDSFYYFGIANLLQKKYDCELYAIIDVSQSLNNFFKNQQLVAFRKVWYLRNEASSTKIKPDLKYLSSIEEKYGILIWQIAFSDGILSTFNKFHQFSHNEILSLITLECQFFEKVLDEVKPNFYLNKSSDNHKTQILEEMCAARKIKVLALNNTRVGFRCIISSGFEKIDARTPRMGEKELKFSTIQEITDYFNNFNKYKQVQSFDRKISTTKRYQETSTDILKSKKFQENYYVNYGKSKSKNLLKILKSKIFLKQWLKNNFINKNTITNIDPNQKFVYFPLMSEPERALTAGAPFFTNQLEVITHIAKSLPVDFKLYVKEHPVMIIGRKRDISFYNKITELPNVRLVHPSINPNELLKKCSLVVSITGTSPVEGALHEKPSIIFGDVSYSNLPFVYRVKKLEELPRIIQDMTEKKFDYSSLGDYISLIHNNTFEFDGSSLIRALRDFYSNVISLNTRVAEKQVQDYLSQHSQDYEKLTSEYIKKIKQN